VACITAVSGAQRKRPADHSCAIGGALPRHSPLVKLVNHHRYCAQGDGPHQRCEDAALLDFHPAVGVPFEDGIRQVDSDPVLANDICLSATVGELFTLDSPGSALVSATC
jgi:hypothetical protein